MFLVLLIGGEDHGQKRLGLMAEDIPTARAERSATELARAEAQPAPASQGPTPIATDERAELAGLVPISPPAPEPAIMRETGPAPVIRATTETLFAEDPLPLLYVRSSAVNVREGPSTRTAIIGRLTRSEAVAVVEPESNGWVHIRIEGDGVDGFIAARLLTDRDPSSN